MKTSYFILSSNQLPRNIFNKDNRGRLNRWAFDDLQSMTATVLPAKSDSDVMFCLQSNEGFIIDRSLVY